MPLFDYPMRSHPPPPPGGRFVIAYQVTMIGQNIVSDDEIYTWGKGARGRLGTGNEEDRSTPTLVKFQEKLRLISLSAYRGTTVAVIKEGKKLMKTLFLIIRLTMGNDLMKLKIFNLRCREKLFLMLQIEIFYMELFMCVLVLS